MSLPLRRALAPALAALVCAAGSAVPAQAASPPASGSPQLVRDPDGVPVVARYDVAAYGADASGRADASAAIQRALDAAGADGGGVVWIGAGSYRVATPLWVPRGVTLLGEWRDPDHGGRRGDRQTTLLADPDPSSPTPFLTLVGGGGVQGLNVYYPRQRADQPIAYAPTVRLGGGGSQFASVKQVTLVNPYEAVRAGTDNNELGVLNEVRMSPLRRAITIDFATDVGRIEDVAVAPRFWARWDATPEGAIAAQSRANVIGLDIGRSDTQYVKGLEVTDAAVGVRLRTDRGVVNDVTTSSSGQYADLELRRVGTGVRLDDVNTIAVQLTHARIDAEQAGIATGERFAGTTFNCQDCRVTASQGAAVDLGAGSDGVVGLYASSLRGAAGGPAAVVAGGALQLQRSTVQRPRRGAAIELRSGAGALDLVDSNLGRGDVASAAAPDAGVTVENGITPALRPAPQAPRLPAPPRPRGSALVDATAAPYGADPTGAADATAAIQRALDATARRGGGIAYLPAGRYTLEGALTVPSGVELRGAQITPFHTNAAATVLYVTGGAGSADGPAAITVQAHAGVSGLLTWYPRQSADAPTPYPYAVRLAGRDAWARMVDVGNAWQGVDAASADTTGHQLDWVVGAPLKTGIALGRSNGGVVRRTHFNPHFWFRTTGTTLPGAPADWDAMMALFFKIMKIQDTTLDAFLLGSARNEVIDQAFAYRQKVGAHFVRQDGRGFEGLLYGFWIDAAVDSYVVGATGPRGVDCVNCDAGAVPWGFDATRGQIPTPDPDSFSESYVRLEPGAGAASQLRLFNFGGNAFNWNPFRGVVVRDGSLQLAQAAFSANPRDDGGALQLLGGTTDAAALSFNRTGRIAPDNVSFLRQPVWTDVHVAAGVRHARVAGVVARDGVKNVLPSQAPRVSVRGEVVLR